MARQLEPWGGEVRLPRWLRSLLRRPPDAEDSPARIREQHQRQQPEKTVMEAADRAAVGPMSELYRDGRKNRKRH